MSQGHHDRSSCGIVNNTDNVTNKEPATGSSHSPGSCQQKTSATANGRDNPTTLSIGSGVLEARPGRRHQCNGVSLV